MLLSCSLSTHVASYILLTDAHALIFYFSDMVELFRLEQMTNDHKFDILFLPAIFIYWLVTKEQCREGARIYTCMPVYTGIWKKSPLFRSYFCDFAPYFCDFCDIERYL